MPLPAHSSVSATSTDMLHALRRKRSLLERPAYLWERLSPHCDGDCRQPIVIAETLQGRHLLTCCDFFAIHEQHAEVVTRERTLRLAVTSGRA